MKCFPCLFTQSPYYVTNFVDYWDAKKPYHYPSIGKLMLCNFQHNKRSHLNQIFFKIFLSYWFSQFLLNLDVPTTSICFSLSVAEHFDSGKFLSIARQKCFIWVRLWFSLCNFFELDFITCLYWLIIVTCFCLNLSTIPVTKIIIDSILSNINVFFFVLSYFYIYWTAAVQPPETELQQNHCLLPTLKKCDLSTFGRF